MNCLIIENNHETISIVLILSHFKRSSQMLIILKRDYDEDIIDLKIGFTCRL